MENRFWKDELENFFLFYNLQIQNNENKNFDKIKRNFKLDFHKLNLFLTQNNITTFDFYTSIISLYLSRSTNSDGIIFTYSNLNPNDTLFKIKYDAKISILDFIISTQNVINKSLDNSMENMKDYLNELFPEYYNHILNFSIVNAKNNLNSPTDGTIKFIISENSIGIEYDTNAFKRIEIESMLENIEYLIQNSLENANQICCSINIVCENQLDLINTFSQGTDIEISEKLLPDIIHDMANKYPDNFAINDEVNRITYNELDNLINSTTYLLQNEYGISKSDKVILYLSRSYNMPLLTICLMKLGAIVIPIDDSYPNNYIQSIIDNSLPKYIIQESDYEFNNVNIIKSDSLNVGECCDLANVDVDLDDTAMILYTSGTTGIPKGVELTQRNIININFNYLNHFDPPEGGEGNFTCLAKFTFVASLPIYAALMHGFEAFIIRETTKNTIPKIIKYLMENHCYVLISTQDLGLYLYNNFDLNLDALILAGSRLTKSKIRENNQTDLFNAYGCTETSGSVIINKINDDYSNYAVIGRPLGNSKIYILDENKKQVPIGAVGEIVISGPIVSKQYFNNPEQTSKAYTEFNNEPVYFTNDLGYFNNNGEVVYVGRKDEQINLNGFRIEPEGIESTILEYGGINQVKIILGEVNHQNHLIAYYSSDEGIDENDLKENLTVNLPSYMIPSFFIQMDYLPLNPNGKVDIKQLPPIEFNETEFVAARNELEELVVNCFENAFNQNISIYDDFIQLGGTSVIAMEIVGELTDYNLTVNDLIMLKTPEKIAEHINNSEVMDFDWDKYSLDTGCPLNESQLNVYLDIQRYEKNEAYNLPLIISIPQKYGKNDIKKALNKIFDVHPILKSHIEIIDGIPYLKIGNIPKIEYLEEQDNNIILDFINNPFDLKSNLSRYLLLEKDNQIKLIAVSPFDF